MLFRSYYTLPAPTSGFGTVEIVCGTYTSGNAVVTPVNAQGFTTITWPSSTSALGGSVTLKYLSGHWYVTALGGKTPPTVA